jgi:hypothetical protein
MPLPIPGIGVIDVGSPRGGKLGWAIVTPDAPPTLGTDLDAFVEDIALLGHRLPLAIGFEAPLFIPTRAIAFDVLTGRSGEGSRPWSAGAGASVFTAALGVVTYTLAALRRQLPSATPSMDFMTPPVSPGGVLFFEAFVSGAAKGASHADDALIAAREAQRLLCRPAGYRSAIAEPDVFSLLSASLLRTGWSTDIGLLSTPCFVVKPGFDHEVP